MVQLTLFVSSGASTQVSLNNAIPASKSVELLEAIIPNTIYKIRTGVNNIIDFSVGASVFVATIPPGAYTFGSLMVAIVTAMKAQTDNTWTATANSDTFKVTITGASNFILLFGSGTNKTTSMATFLGFTAADTASGTTATGTNALQLANPFSVYVRIQELGNNIYTSSGQNFTYRLPLVVESGSIAEIDVNSDYRQILPLNQQRIFQNFTVSLCYADGSAIDLNGSSYELVLEIL